ncbi:alpha/beta hydrolase [Labrys neptuniae]
MSNLHRPNSGARKPVRLTAAWKALALATVIVSCAGLPALAAEAKAGNADNCDPGIILTETLPDPVSGRSYDIEVSLPSGYDAAGSKRFPVLFLADGGRGMRHRTCQVKTLHDEGSLAEEPIIIGLSYAKGEDLQVSRKRDYTPVPLKPGDTTYGSAAAYQTYLAKTVIPYVEDHYRADASRRLYWGHSYGGLLGTRILLTEPGLFRTYILGSPSLWFADHAIWGIEAGYAKANTDLKADVLMYVGGAEVARYDPRRRGKTRDMVGDMKAFEARLKERGFASLTIHTLVVPGKDHRTTIRPGFAWAITAALGGAQAAR